jgi:hypothetical protein
LPEAAERPGADRAADNLKAERVGEVERRICDVGIEIRVSTSEADRILADKALPAGVIVARPTVAPVASLAGKSTAARMRVAAIRLGYEHSK